MPKKTKKGPHMCEMCEKDISHRHRRTKRCKKCAEVHKREYFRMYMAKYTLKKRQEKFNERTLEDGFILSEHHMTGLGTFTLPQFDGDFEKEFENVRKLKEQVLK